MAEPRRDFDEEEDRTFIVKDKFNKFTYWNLDKPPSENDKFPNAMKWVDIASAVS